MVKVAVRNPVAPGVNVMLNVVLPLDAIEFDGMAVTAKSAAFVPLIATYGEAPVKFKVADPVF